MTTRPSAIGAIFASAFLILTSMIVMVGAFTTSLQQICLRNVVSQVNGFNPMYMTEESRCNVVIRQGCSEVAVEISSQTTREANAASNQFLLDRRSYLTFGLAASAAAATWSAFAQPSSAKSYSENAKNLERINNGDYSGGAVFDNNPSTERGKKRRAMTGCKTTLSREEASNTILKRSKMLSEKECNQMVMAGESEFMLQALRNLDCPTCANGIGRTN